MRMRSSSRQMPPPGSTATIRTGRRTDRSWPSRVVPGHGARRDGADRHLGRRCGRLERTAGHGLPPRACSGRTRPGRETGRSSRSSVSTPPGTRPGAQARSRSWISRPAGSGSSRRPRTARPPTTRRAGRPTGPSSCSPSRRTRMPPRRRRSRARSRSFEPTGRTAPTHGSSRSRTCRSGTRTGTRSTIGSCSRRTPDVRLGHDRPLRGPRRRDRLPEPHELRDAAGSTRSEPSLDTGWRADHVQSTSCRQRRCAPDGRLHRRRWVGADPDDHGPGGRPATETDAIGDARRRTDRRRHPRPPRSQTMPFVRRAPSQAAHRRRRDRGDRLQPGCSGPVRHPHREPIGRERRHEPAERVTPPPPTPKPKPEPDGRQGR